MEVVLFVGYKIIPLSLAGNVAGARVARPSVVTRVLRRFGLRQEEIVFPSDLAFTIYV